MNETNVENNQSSDSKKIITLVVLILTIMVCTTSATYAFFAIGANNTTTVTGKAATASLSLTVNKVLPTATNTGVMVPQYSYNGTSATYAAANDVLMKAVNTGKCVDGNKNIICQVYTIQVKNNSTATASIRGTFTLSGGTYNNLKWYILEEKAGNVPADAATKTYTNINSSGTLTQKNGSTTRYIYGYAKSNTALTNNAHGYSSSTLSTISLTSGSSHYYTIIVWIEEIDSDQSAKDNGTFTGTVDFYAVNNSGTRINGITSTITG